MKIPGHLFLGALALLSSPAIAQSDPAIGLKFPTGKGNWMLGSNLVVGELAFGSTNSDVGLQGVYNVSINPRAGYFVKDNLMVGGMLNATFSGSSFGNDPSYSYHSQVAGLGVFARKYFGKSGDKNGEMNKFRFFVEAGGSFNKGWTSYKTSPGVTEHGNFTTGTLHVMPGFNYFFTKNVALEGGLHMSHTAASKNVVGNANRVGINLGLQIFLGK